jgi:hypothetical protein
MNRLAVFVEGNTEILFVKKLIEELAGRNRVLIEHWKIWGGKTVPRRMARMTATRRNTGQEYYVLLVDCGGDEGVKSRILEEHEKLSNTDYEKIIGIRDVRPKFTHAHIPRLRTGLATRIRPELIPVRFILAVMEIEAWFLAEATHYPKIDPAITVEAIRGTLGFDPENDDMEQRPEPAKDLNDCYAIGGKTYTKRRARATVASLDYAQVYIKLRQKSQDLDQLIADIDAFLS